MSFDIDLALRLPTAWLLAQVFARVSPDQKELVLRTLRAAGWTTLMCGDGTNDVGALKAAHVGVALLPPSEAQLKAQKEREEQLRQRQKDIAARKAAIRAGRPMPPPQAPAASPAQLVAPSPSAQGIVASTGAGTVATFADLAMPALMWLSAQATVEVALSL